MFVLLKAIFAASKNLVVKSTMFPHLNIHKYTWTSPDGQTHNQVDHILIDRRWHSSILDVRSFRGDDCNSDHYLVVNGFGGLGVACWPLVPKFAGSNPAEAVGFLGAKKSSARLPSEGK